MTFRQERGQAAVLTVVFLTVLLGMAGLVLDVGSWYRAQRATQSAADAAALAAAQALPESPAAARTLANEYVAKNGGGEPEITFSSRVLPDDTVTIRLARNAPGVFTKLFGISSVNVGARAVARAGGLAKARWAAPIGVDQRHPLLQCKPLPCFGEETTLDLEKVGPGAFRLLNLDGSKGGTGPGTLADWVTRGFDGYMPLGWYGSDPGTKFNSSQVKDAMSIRIGDELLFPIYLQTRENGANFEYEVSGWVGFVVTRFSGNGNHGTISGAFERVIWEGIQSDAGAKDDYGARAVALVG